MQSKSQNLKYKTFTRNYGIDFLRIISMIMICLLHTLGQGGILENSIPFSIKYEIVWFLEIAAYCAVNSYALISGYVGYGKKQKYSNIIYLCFQVVFYTLTTTVIFFICKPELFSIKTLVKAMFPFAYKTYWYFSAYFCLSFLMPLLNTILDKFNKKEIQKLLLTLFFVFSLLPTFFYSDFGITHWGYSFLWLAILYLVGAYIKKYGFPNFHPNWKNLLGYFSFVIITWLSKLFIELFTNMIFNEPKYGGYLINYTSPTIVFCSIFLFLFCININYGKTFKKFICFFAPVTFGVYLFHQARLIVNFFISNAFVSYITLTPILMVPAIIGTAVCIWLIGSLVDKIRLGIFNLLKINQLSIFLEHKINNLLLQLKKIINIFYKKLQKTTPNN